MLVRLCWTCELVGKREIDSEGVREGEGGKSKRENKRGRESGKARYIGRGSERE